MTGAIPRERKHRSLKWTGVCAVLCVLSTANIARADDSAAAVGAGGLVARRETRIIMAKEVLKISPTKVVVDYDFRNDSDEDVTTEVAFPVPPYSDEIDEPAVSLESFSDFKVEVDGKPVSFKAEARAFLKRKDVTDLLYGDKIDIQSFGHYDQNKMIIHDLDRLPEKEQRRLETLGLFDLDPPKGNWIVHLQYHWTQRFPARSTVHIRHEYTPIVGFTQISIGDLEDALNHPHSTGSVHQTSMLQSVCAEKPFLTAMEGKLRAIEARAKTDDERMSAGVAYPHWVDFILTSANTWRRPIEDFTLIVDRGALNAGESKMLVSFCSPDGAPVEKIDSYRFKVHLTNLVPKTELRIGFFDLPTASQQPAK